MTESRPGGGAHQREQLAERTGFDASCTESSELDGVQEPQNPAPEAERISASN
jgi:hypothetical protein